MPAFIGTLGRTRHILRPQSYRLCYSGEGDSNPILAFDKLAQYQPGFGVSLNSTLWYLFQEASVNLIDMATFLRFPQHLSASTYTV